MDGIGSPAVFVEAKKLGEPLEPHREQMVTYANMQGVKFAALTDGSRWELYKVFEPKPLEERRKMEVDIRSVESVQSCALQLLMLWRPNLESGSPVKPNEPVVNPGKQQPPARSGPPRTGERWLRPPKVDADAESSTGERWLRLPKVDADAESSKPLKMRIQGGPEIQLGTWKAILKGGADWLGSNGYLSNIRVPMRIGRSWLLINSSPTHLSGSNFKSQHSIEDTELYIETNFNKKNCVDHAKKLFSYCQVDPDSVEVLFRRTWPVVDHSTP